MKDDQGAHRRMISLAALLAAGLASSAIVAPAAAQGPPAKEQDEKKDPRGKGHQRPPQQPNGGQPQRGGPPQKGAPHGASQQGAPPRGQGHAKPPGPPRGASQQGERAQPPGSRQHPPGKTAPPAVAKPNPPPKQPPPGGRGAPPSRETTTAPPHKQEPPRANVPPRGGPGGPPNQQGQAPRGGPPDKGGAPRPTPSTAAPGPRSGPGGPGPDRGDRPDRADSRGPGGQRPPFAGGPGPRRIDEVKKERVETVSKSGARIIREPGGRTIVRQNNRTIITHNEGAVFNRFTPNAARTQRRDGGSQTVLNRPGGVKVYSDFDKDGRLLRRYRRDPSGREFVYVDNRRFYRNLAVGVGVGALAAAAIVALAPPAHSLPRDKYIVEYVDASDDDLYETLTAPPVERLDRGYSLEEIRYSHSLRERMRRVDLDNINFETGSFDVAPDQYDKLARIAHVLRRVIDRDPTEVFLIEGHTDAVGSDEDNLSLSDHRAESVAQILVEHFEIPIENLSTQGYGEQYLKVDSQEAERANRRVALRRITPLLSRAE